MRKLGIIDHDADADHAAAKDFDKFLKSRMQPRHFAALRDIFPLANDLTDDQLMQTASRPLERRRGKLQNRSMSHNMNTANLNILVWNVRAAHDVAGMHCVQWQATRTPPSFASRKRSFIYFHTSRQLRLLATRSPRSCICRPQGLAGKSCWPARARTWCVLLCIRAGTRSRRRSL
uniref:Uncharacterized protein n=1 Tax=Setaria viridis TaxID=4556 RepID=A0A4U6VF44_SETVI|nr:hypothetical protein SEVIR_4G247100v2 [Setaria viridis]